jgi:hypothetical protein
MAKYCQHLTTPDINTTWEELQNSWFMVVRRRKVLSKTKAIDTFHLCRWVSCQVEGRNKVKHRMGLEIEHN